MTIDFEKKYSVEEFQTLISTLNFPVNINGEVILGFELLSNGHLNPMPPTPLFKESVVTKLVVQLELYANSGLTPGVVTSSQGGFKIEDFPLQVNDGNGHPVRTIRAPDAAFTPRQQVRELDANQLHTFLGEPFTPTVAFEVEDIAKRHMLVKMRAKIRDEYLGPRSSIRWALVVDAEHERILEFYKQNGGGIVETDHDPWVTVHSPDDVLPGFVLDPLALKHSVEENLLTSSTEEEEDGEEDDEWLCQKCGEDFNSVDALIYHMRIAHSDPNRRRRELRKRARGKTLSPRKQRRQ